RSRRQIAILEIRGIAWRAAVARRHPRGDLDDDRLGTVDAKTHLAPHRPDAALVSASLRRDDRRLDPGQAPPARQPVWHFARGTIQPLEQCKDADLKDPTDRNHGLDPRSMATRFADAYKERKSQSKESGLEAPRALPGVHHPIFRGKPVNYDPRERFIAEFMAKRGDY